MFRDTMSQTCADDIPTGFQPQWCRVWKHIIRRCDRVKCTESLRQIPWDQICWYEWLFAQSRHVIVWTHIVYRHKTFL